jgi:hypothetical protein
MPDQSTRHSLDKPLGNENFTRAAYRALIDEIDAAIATTAEITAIADAEADEAEAAATAAAAALTEAHRTDTTDVHGIADTSALAIRSAAAAWTARQDFRTVTEERATDAAFAGAETIDCAASEVHALTLTGNVTGITFTNVPAAGKTFALTLLLKQDGTGSRTVAWPASVKWPGGVAPTLTTTAGRTDVITLLTHDGGTTWLGFVGGLNFNA